MEINKFITQHGKKTFKVDGEYNFGSFMLIDDLTVYIRKDDVMLAHGLTVEEFHPLINKLSRMHS